MTFETANSTYVVDVKAQTVTRQPMSGELRRDGEALSYLAIGPVVVGRPVEMLLALRLDGVPTYRVTSPVLRVSDSAGPGGNRLGP